MRQWEGFREKPIGNPMLRSGFAFHSCQTPHAKGKRITRAKARRVSKVADLTDLYEMASGESVL